MGVLSALPLISAGNVCCCLWIVSGGVVAAYVLQENQAAPIATGDAALAGPLAGIAGAFIHLVLALPIAIVRAPLHRALTHRCNGPITLSLGISSSRRERKSKQLK